MNGRIYDALLGRFLSADLIVQSPGSLQSFNRYSYVMNNPLTLVDPSGYASSSLVPSREDIEEKARKSAESQARGEAIARYGIAGYAAGLGNAAINAASDVAAFFAAVVEFGRGLAGKQDNRERLADSSVQPELKEGVKTETAPGTEAEKGKKDEKSDAPKKNTLRIDPNGNCYAHACGQKAPFKKNYEGPVQPGDPSGKRYSEFTTENIKQAAIRDGLSETQIPNSTRVFLVVGTIKNYDSKGALQTEKADYHWYREESEGHWTHKPGHLQAISVDGSNRPIADPSQSVGKFIININDDKGNKIGEDRSDYDVRNGVYLWVPNNLKF